MSNHRNLIITICAAVFVLVLSMIIAFSAFPAQAAVDPVVLRIVLWDYEKNIYDQRIIEAFERDNPDIRIDVISFPAEYYINSLMTLMDTHMPADIIYVNQQQTNFPPLAERDILLGLDDFISANEIDLSCYPDLGAFRDRQTGELLALPYRKDKLHLFYNRSLFDAAGMPYPHDGITWYEFASIAEELHERLAEQGSDDYGALFTLNDWRLIHMFNGGYFDYLSDSADGIYSGLLLMGGLEASGSVPIASDLERLGVSQRYFELGQFGMFVHGTWYTHYLYHDTEDGVIGFEWGFTSCPVWEKGETNDDAWMDCLSILKSSEHQEEAFRFVQYATGPEGAAIMAREHMMPAYSDDSISGIFAMLEQAGSLPPGQFETSFDTPSAMLSPVESDLVAEFSSIFSEAKLDLITGEEMIQKMHDARAKALDNSP